MEGIFLMGCGQLFDVIRGYGVGKDTQDEQ
jgi:hypothetical protein